MARLCGFQVYDSNADTYVNPLRVRLIRIGGAPGVTIVEFDDSDSITVALSMERVRDEINSALNN